MIQERKEKTIKDALEIFKFVAFHELYMEKFRQDLCKDQNYDSGVAFNTLDLFKHNKIIPQEILIFLKTKVELQQTQASISQCNQLIKSLDKGAFWLDYEGFKQLSLSRKNVQLKELSLNRLKNIKPGIGTFQKVLTVKQWSQKKVIQLIEKQIKFIRELHFRKQQFTMSYKGDIYTILQEFFHQTYRKYQSYEKQKIGYNSFYQKCRKYKIIFNQDQFEALTVRTRKLSFLDQEKLKKNMSNQASNELSEQLCLTKDNFTELLVTSNLSLKQQFGNQENLPTAKIFQRRPSSYIRKVNENGNLVRNQNSFQAKMEAEQAIRVHQKLRDERISKLTSNIGRIRYPYYIAEQSSLPLTSFQFKFREKQRLLDQRVKNMDMNGINSYYMIYDKKK